MALVVAVAAARAGGRWYRRSGLQAKHAALDGVQTARRAPQVHAASCLAP